MTDLALNPDEHPWMTAPGTRAVMRALNGDGGDCARFVGGCVRNALLGEPVDDVDIATQLEPEHATRCLQDAGIKVVPTGIDHGTLTAVVDGEPYEVTSLRKDVETFGRRAAVAFTTDWTEDALRRDFRVNAIYARSDGSLFDAFGGLEDIAARRIVFIGEARDRIAEDHLRILRFYRFTAWYGHQLDGVGHAACVEMAETLKALSAERIWKELKKLLAAPDPGDIVKAMHEGHVLSQVLTRDIDFNLFLAIINVDRGKSRQPDPLLRLAALLGGDETAMMTLCEKMKVSNAEAHRLAAMSMPDAVSGPDAYAPGLGTEAREVALYHFGVQAFSDRLRLAEARGLGDADEDLAAAAHWSQPRFPVTGKDLIEAGFERGPLLGAKLKTLEAAWIESGFSLSAEDLLALARGGSA